MGIGLTEHLDSQNRHVAGDEWNQFVEEYLSEIPSVSTRKPYRERNRCLAVRALQRLITANLSAKEKAKREVATEAVLFAQAMKHAYQKSQLASKLDLRSFKLHFVEFTTDVFVRAAGKTNAKRNAIAKAKRKEQQKKKVRACG